MESLKLAGESSINPSEASSSPLATVGLVGRPSDELGKGVQSVLASISLESLIRDGTMLCEQGEFTKNSVEGVAIANNLQYVLEQPSAELKAKPSFRDMVIGLGNGAWFTSTIPELDVEDNCLPSEDEKSGNTIIDMTVVEPVEKFGPWMQVTSKHTRCNGTGHDGNKSLSAGTTGPNAMKGRYEVLRLQEGVARQLRVVSPSPALSLVEEVGERCDVPVMRSASSELRVHQRAKEHTVAPGKQSESHVMKAKQVLLKGFGSAYKGGNRFEKEISEIVHTIHVVQEATKKSVQMSPAVVATEIMVPAPSKLNPSNHLAVKLLPKESNEGEAVSKQPSLDVRSMSSGVALDRRLSKVKGVARCSPYPSRRKPPDRKENMDPNIVDVGEWERELSKKLSVPMPSENGDTRSVQLAETNAEADGPSGMMRVSRRL
ncbi:hypothetical protein V6N13_108362 [Hibiscus sabdariffa]|uniref:Uncharacterized protein n=2 Tax=Hibiscus sabdariffa TaxID=183260 RepID=A0ABR1ZPK5_9ROSI